MRQILPVILTLGIQQWILPPLILFSVISNKGYLLSLASKFINKSDKQDIWKREGLAYFASEDDNGIPFLM